MTKTYQQKPAEVTRAWHLVDAEGRVLGQVATEIATKLIGKHKPTFTPHVDGGDFVVVINAAHIVVSGNKLVGKQYTNYSGFPGGLKKRALGDMLAQQPTEVIERAVYNMLPKNKHRSGRMTRLKVYAAAEHKHQSQLNSKEVGDK